MDPWLEATGAGRAFFFWVCSPLMSGFFARGYRLPHIPHPHVDHDGTGVEHALFLLAQGLVEAQPVGPTHLPFPFPVGQGGSAIGEP